jgi:hypothetical protein
MQMTDFRLVTPSPNQQVEIADANVQFQTLADWIIGGVDPSAHRTVALRKLLESKMTLIHAITHPTDKS